MLYGGIVAIDACGKRIVFVGFPCFGDISARWLLGDNLIDRLAFYLAGIHSDHCVRIGPVLHVRFRNLSWGGCLSLVPSQGGEQGGIPKR